MVTTIGLSFGAALFLAAGFVIQQHAAAQEPPSERLSFRLLLKLVQRPVWLGGGTRCAKRADAHGAARDMARAGPAEPWAGRRGA